MSRHNEETVMNDDDDKKPELEPLESYEDLGPDDLELVQTANPIPPEEDEWFDPEYESEQKEWRESLLDQDRPDPHGRVVSLGCYRALVFERRRIRLVDWDTEDTSFVCPYFDPKRKSDEQVRHKYKKYRTFS